MKRALGFLALGLLAGAAAQAAAPPVTAPRQLTFWEGWQLARLDGQISAHALAGRFEEAAKLARQAWELRRRAQGPGHWQTVDAGLEMARAERLVKVPARARAEVARSLGLEQQGLLLHRQGRYAEAEKVLRKVLALRLEVLGKEHLETADSTDQVAMCLNALGRSGEALPLHRKALGIYRQALGEEHPKTAESYSNLGSCLEALGRSGEALPLYEKALAVFRKVLGEEHPHTAQASNNMAVCLHRLGRSGEALPLFRKALAARRKVLGEEHPLTASSYNNLAGCLEDLGRPGQALPLFQKALGIYRKVLGDRHPLTATCFNQLAVCLHALGRSGEALPLFQKALAVRRSVLGEDHPDTATSTNDVAACLDALGRSGEALHLHRKALAVYRQALGEEHPKTAESYSNVASCLEALGKSGEALPLYEKALAVFRKALGEEHPHTAQASNNMAVCLHRLGRSGEALPLFQKALAARRKVLGEEHPLTASSYNNLAYCLNALGRPGQALPLYQKALGAYRKALGEEHPQTALAYNNVAVCLHALGRPGQALPLSKKALAAYRQALGEEHPDTALISNNVAAHHWQQGDRAQALLLLQATLPGQEAARFHKAPSGFDRALAAADRVSPHTLLAVGLARLGQPGNAYRHAEASLARGLLDDLASPASPAGSRALVLQARLHQVDARLLPLLGLVSPSADQRALRDELLRERRRAGAELARLAAEASTRQVLPLGRAQASLPADGALVFWQDVPALSERWGCVVRREGPPAWVPLPGSGKGGAWLDRDRALSTRLDEALRQPGKRVPPDLLDDLRAQRLGPLLPYLKARAGLPEVKQLFVVPVGPMALVPVELLSDRFAVRYVSSGSVLARTRDRHRPLAPGPVLALGDPAFAPDAAKRPEPPAHGLVLRLVLPTGVAGRAGLRSGDVLLKVAGKKLETVADLKEALARPELRLTVWREGETFEAKLRAAGRLGVAVDNRPAAEAVRARRELEALSVPRGAPLARLPGTRVEVEALARLVPGTTKLLGSAASEKELDALARSGKLKSYRLIHLGTHGLVDHDSPERSSLALARDALPTAAEGAEAVLKGRRAFTGELTVGDIRSRWRLDADLVVLSACSTAQGKEAGGDGLLGFAHAFQQAGARSVLLTRWQVDDEAAALLMVRFYENLLGKREGVGPMPRAAALREAKEWLRNLSAKAVKVEAERLPRGKGAKPVPLRKEARPFAHPYYWAAFTLLGDPD